MNRPILFVSVLLCLILLVANLAFASKFAIIGRKPPKEEPIEEVEPPPPTTYGGEGLGVTHVVVKGECLFFIAGYREYYGDPFKWRLIYEANKDRIANPHWIYPGQEFYIPPE